MPIQHNGTIKNYATFGECGNVYALVHIRRVCSLRIPRQTRIAIIRILKKKWKC